MEELDNFIHSKELYVRNYLLKKGSVIDDLWGLSSKWKEYFYLFEEMSDADRTSYFLSDVNYIEGAMRVWSYGREILSFQEWDLIDQLWSYFIQAFEKIILNKAKSAFFFFPDQPLKVELEHVKPGIKLKIGGGKEFVLSMKSVAYFLGEGKLFLTAVQLSINNTKYNFEIELVDSMIEKIRA